MKKVIQVVTALLLVFILPITASASSLEARVSQPRYTHIDGVYASLSIDSSNGLATCTGTAYAKASDSIVELTVQLQQCKNDTWYTLKTWSGSDTNMAVVTGKYYVYKGYTYRTKVSVVMYDADGNYLESTIGTQEKTY